MALFRAKRNRRLPNIPWLEAAGRSRVDRARRKSRQMRQLVQLPFGISRGAAESRRNAANHQGAAGGSIRGHRNCRPPRRMCCELRTPKFSSAAPRLHVRPLFVTSQPNSLMLKMRIMRKAGNQEYPVLPFPAFLPSSDRPQRIRRNGCRSSKSSSASPRLRVRHFSFFAPGRFFRASKNAPAPVHNIKRELTLATD